MHWDDLAEILKALGHPIRLQIVSILCSRDENVGNLAREIGASSSSISQQLSILRMRGLVSRRYNGGHAFYKLEEPRLRDMIACMSQCDPKSLRSMNDTAEDEITSTTPETQIASEGKGGR